MGAGEEGSGTQVTPGVWAGGQWDAGDPWGAEEKGSGTQVTPGVWRGGQWDAGVP